MSNMDEFNRITVIVLGKLYDAFPQPIRVLVEDVIEKPNEKPDENTIRNFDATVRFLASEGFLKYESESDEGLFFYETSLTMKGLRILRAVPSALEEKQSIGQKFVEITKSGTREASKEILKTVVNQLMAAASGQLVD